MFRRKTYAILAFLLMTPFSPALFAQISPCGFLGCDGDDPNKWAEDAGPGECVASSGHNPRGTWSLCGCQRSKLRRWAGLFLGALANVFSSAVNYGFGDYLGPAAPIAETRLGNQFREPLEGRIDSKASCQIVSVKLPLGATDLRSTMRLGGKPL